MPTYVDQGFPYLQACLPSSLASNDYIGHTYIPAGLFAQYLGEVASFHISGAFELEWSEVYAIAIEVPTGCGVTRGSLVGMSVHTSVRVSVRMFTCFMCQLPGSA